MGIPGILKDIGKGQRIALSKLAVDHLQRTKRPLRIAIDAAIWGFQNQASQGGLNPEVRVLYYRLLRLLALPIHPLFVYDGPNKPRLKRNKKVGVWNSAELRLSKNLLQLFHYPYLTAPGEAEAQCATLQKLGIVDAVMSQDADAVMFGSNLTLKNWSHDSTKGSHAPTHVDILDSAEIARNTGLDTAGMILVALLSGGDYDTVGVPGFGSGIACEIAKAKDPNFAADLLRLKLANDEEGLRQWRETLNHELHTNERHLFKSRHKTISIPENFPDATILRCYTDPAVSSEDECEKIRRIINAEWAEEVNLPQNITLLREFTRDQFEWNYKSGARKFIRGFAPSLLAQRLRLKKPINGILGSESFISRGTKFENDGISEIRFQYIPHAMVPLDLSQEEENPAYMPQVEDIDGNEQQESMAENYAVENVMSSQPDMPPTPSKPKVRKSPPWDPYALEKHWLPEIIVKMGVPEAFDVWDRQQDELRKDPKKWATRKCAKPKVKDSSMKAGALDTHFRITKPGTQSSSTKSTTLPEPVSSASSVIIRPAQSRTRKPTKNVVEASPQKERSIAHFFQPYAQRTSPEGMGMARALHIVSATSANARAMLAMTNDTMDPGSPTPRRIRRGEADAANPILLSSSPASIPSASEYLTSISTSFSTMVPSPSSPAFETMCSNPNRRPTSKASLKPGSSFTSRSRISKSGSPQQSTMISSLKTTKSTSSKTAGKVTVIARDSLPGAWREVELGSEDYEMDGDGVGRRRGRAAQRVSLIDLTGL